MLQVPIIRIALSVPLRCLFDYRTPTGETLTPEDVGRRVRVRFGTRIEASLSGWAVFGANLRQPLRASMR